MAVRLEFIERSGMSPRLVCAERLGCLGQTFRNATVELFRVTIFEDVLAVHALAHGFVDPVDRRIVVVLTHDPTLRDSYTDSYGKC